MPSFLKSNRGSIALYATVSLLLLSSIFLLFTSYSAEVGALAAGAQEDFHISLLAGRISNLAKLAEDKGVESETVLANNFFLYGVKPANYTIEATNEAILLESANARARIKTSAIIALEEKQNHKILRVKER